jgi:RNA polymerase sporulation-specific sigma factor
VKELYLRLTRLRDSFMAENGREPTVGELSALCGESCEAVVEAISAGRPPVSLTVQTEDGIDETDVPVPSSDKQILEELALSKALEQLCERDRMLITLRYFRDKTQSETAAALGMTQVQVSRREKKLLAALREKLE